MNKPTRVNILGTEYKIIYDKDLIECRGYCEFFIKEIHVADSLFEDSEGDFEHFSSLYKSGYKTLRHEMIHAFMFESGLWNNCDWARNEEMTDWIAMQIPKISRCFNQLKILED